MLRNIDKTFSLRLADVSTVKWVAGLSESGKKVCDENCFPDHVKWSAKKLQKMISALAKNDICWCKR